MNCRVVAASAERRQQAHSEHITDTGAVKSKAAIFRRDVPFYQT